MPAVPTTERADNQRPLLAVHHAADSSAGRSGATDDQRVLPEGEERQVLSEICAYVDIDRLKLTS